MAEEAVTVIMEVPGSPLPPSDEDETSESTQHGGTAPLTEEEQALLRAATDKFDALQEEISKSLAPSVFARFKCHVAQELGISVANDVMPPRKIKCELRLENAGCTAIPALVKLHEELEIDVSTEDRFPQTAGDVRARLEALLQDGTECSGLIPIAADGEIAEESVANAHRIEYSMKRSAATGDITYVSPQFKVGFPRRPLPAAEADLSKIDIRRLHQLNQNGYPWLIEKWFD